MQQLIIALLIFFAKATDVCLDTVCTILATRGMRYMAAFIGFFEVLIWIVVISHIIKNYSGLVNYIAYAAGFGLGSYVGITIEEKLSMGNVLVRMIAKGDATELINALRQRHYGITCMDAKGAEGNVKVILSVVRRKMLRDVVEVLSQANPTAFYTVEDIRFVTKRNLFPYPPMSKSGFTKFRSLLAKDR